ncbi:MAG: hypothetical protein EA378_00395, partial [Phycisphaerales bacterium]
MYPLTPEPETDLRREPAFVRRYRAIAAGALCPLCGYETEPVGEAEELAWVCAKCGLEGVPGRAVLEPYPEGSGVENALYQAAWNLAISTGWLLFFFVVSIACIVVTNVWTRQHDLTLWAS